MPANSRCHIINEFNEGKWPYIIASECNDVFDESEEQIDNSTNNVSNTNNKLKENGGDEVIIIM